MKYLIPYLQDDQKAADYLRQLRWPNGVTCPRCGGDAVEPGSIQNTCQNRSQAALGLNRTRKNNRFEMLILGEKTLYHDGQTNRCPKKGLPNDNTAPLILNDL